MINITQFNQIQILIFALVLLRCSSFVLSAAVFSTHTINPLLKVLFSVSLTMVLFPLQKLNQFNLDWLNDNLIPLVIREVILGLLLGIMTRIFFFVVSMAGELFSMSLGLSAAQIFNPLTGAQNQIFDQFYTWLAMMIFFALDGHHILVTALSQSFEFIPVAQLKFQTSVFLPIVTHFDRLMTMTIQIAAPILVAMLISNISMGILGRTVPQINVMVTSFPLSILLGLGILILTMPLWSTEMNSVLEYTASELWKVMKAI